jgi:hypothetical protein
LFIINYHKIIIKQHGLVGNNLGNIWKIYGLWLVKQGGFCEVNGSRPGVDAFSNPTILQWWWCCYGSVTGSNTVGYVRYSQVFYGILF